MVVSNIYFVVFVCAWWCPTYILLCLFTHGGVQHIFCCVFALFIFVLCALCCQFLWIVHFWLPLRYSLTFIAYKYVQVTDFFLFNRLLITNESILKKFQSAAIIWKWNIYVFVLDKYTCRPYFLNNNIMITRTQHVRLDIIFLK
jgi:hypothetical protein